MLPAQIIKAMDDHHLLASFYANYDSTLSALEIELAKRFEKLLDQKNDALNDAVNEFEFTADDIKEIGYALFGDVNNTVALLDEVAKAGLETPKSLKTELDFAKKCRAIIEDAEDVFSRLNDLVSAEQE